MKKILSFLFLLVVAFSLVACRDKGGDDNGGSTPAVRTYVADGKYTAYSVGYNYGAPQLNWVTVTIKNDKIESFYIDQLQSGAEGWNEKTKKELKYDYGMKDAAIDKDGDGQTLEWFEQAALLEAKFLEDLAGVTVVEGYFTGISGVSIADNDYVMLANKAVANAKAGIVNQFVANMYNGAINLVSVSAKVNAEGKIVEAKLDELQTSNNEWKAQTKQELGTNYGMSGAAIDKNGDGITLEWFEQANAITTAWLAGTNIADITTISGVSITDNDYNTVLAKLLADGWTK